MALNKERNSMHAVRISVEVPLFAVRITIFFAFYNDALLFLQVSHKSDVLEIAWENEVKNDWL